MSFTVEQIMNRVREKLNSPEAIGDLFSEIMEKERLKSHPWLKDLTLLSKYIAREISLPHYPTNPNGGGCLECTKMYLLQQDFLFERMKQSLQSTQDSVSITA